MYGQKPKEAKFYARQGRFEMVVWNDPPPGDSQCVAFSGRTENQLVRDILDGKYNHLFKNKPRMADSMA